MRFDWGKMERSKRGMREKLAARPIAEKLALLDTLRERALALRNAETTSPTQHNPNHPAREVLPHMSTHVAAASEVKTS